jgi:sugar phosphate isomerase/epimerase
LPIEDALAKMVELDYDAVELWSPQLKEFRTPALRKRLAEYLSSVGLKAVRINAADADYFNTLRSPDDVLGIVEGLKTEINTSNDFGISQLLTWEGRKPENVKREDTFGWIFNESVNIFEQALRHAETRGIKLYVEVHPFTLGIDLDWLIKLHDYLNSSHFGIIYDCCHFGVGLPESYIDAIYKLGKRIKHIHFSDSDKVSSELHFAPGTGCLDLDGIINAFKETGFNGTVMLDLWLYPLPEEGSRTGIQYVRRMLEKLELG